MVARPGGDDVTAHVAHLAQVGNEARAMLAIERRKVLEESTRDARLHREIQLIANALQTMHEYEGVPTDVEQGDRRRRATFDAVTAIALSRLRQRGGVFRD